MGWRPEVVSAAETYVRVMRTRIPALVIALFIPLVVTSAAHAAPPANDHFAAAQTLAGDDPADLLSTTQDATRETGEPNHSEDGTSSRQSVWYRWTAESTRTVSFDTCSTNFDTHLGVYTGTSVNALRTVARNNNGCPAAYGSRVVFNARAGVTYRIAVDGCCGAPWGLFTLGFNSPGNDNFAQRMPLAGTAPSVISSAADATTEGAESGSGTKSVWYTWTAPATGDVTMETCGASTTNADTTLRVTTGTAFASLAEVAVNDDTAGCGTAVHPSYGSRVRFAATQGVTYNIRVAFLGVVSPRFRLRINPAASDDLTEAVRLLGRSPFTTGTTAGTSYETGEPSTADDQATGTTWFRWKAPEGEAITLDTCRSAGPTVLRVLTGTAVGSMTEVASNDDGECGGGLSRVTFTPTQFTDYAIQVESQGPGGPIGLNWSPQTTITDAPPATGAESTAQFHFSAGDATPGDGLSFQCSLDGGAWARCDGPETYRGLAPGAHVFAVRAMDGDGSVDPSPATTAFEVTAPEAAPTGPQGPGGPAGADGQAGPQGPIGPSAPTQQPDPELFVVIAPAKLTSVASKRLSVPYVSTGPADVVLEVRRGRKVVARVQGRAKAGRNTIAWNGKDGRKAASAGRYTVVLTGVAPGRKAVDSVALVVKKRK